MNNKYLEKIAETYSVAPHSFDRKYGFSKGVSMSKQEYGDYIKTRKNSGSLANILGPMVVGAAGGAYAGRSLAGKAFSKINKGRVSLPPIGKSISGHLGAMAGSLLTAKYINNKAHDKALEKLDMTSRGQFHKTYSEGLAEKKEKK